MANERKGASAFHSLFANPHSHSRSVGGVPCLVPTGFVLFEMSISESHSAADDAVTHERFRRVMASFVTGVTVVTTQVRGEIRGMTANAFMSGSLDPPLCVISVALKARMHGFLVEAGHFGVNILARGQEPLIGHFSGRPVEGIDPQYQYAGHHAASCAGKLHDRRQGDRAIRLRRSFAFHRSYLRADAHQRRYPDRSAYRPIGIAAAHARTNNLADTRILVSLSLQRATASLFASGRLFVLGSSVLWSSPGDAARRLRTAKIGRLFCRREMVTAVRMRHAS